MFILIRLDICLHKDTSPHFSREKSEIAFLNMTLVAEANCKNSKPQTHAVVQFNLTNIYQWPNKGLWNI